MSLLAYQALLLPPQPECVFLGPVILLPLYGTQCLSCNPTGKNPVGLCRVNAEARQSDHLGQFTYLENVHQSGTHDKSPMGRSPILLEDDVWLHVLHLWGNKFSLGLCV